MKKSSVMPIIAGLALTIPLLYWRGYADNTAMGMDAQTQIDFSTELASVKMELKQLKQSYAELAAIKQKMLLLEARQFNTQMPLRKANQPQTTATLGDISETAHKDPAELAQRQADYNAKQQSQMDTAFLAEPSDTEWAPETTQLVGGFFGHEKGSHLNVSDIQCRKTLCKVELNQVNPAKAANVLALHFPLYIGKALSQARYFQTQNDNGTVDMTIYLARNGYDLPDEI